MQFPEVRPPSYVGVSGVVSPEIESELEEIAHDAGIFAAGSLLALGVKAVHKTQWLDIENKYGAEWFPVGESEFTKALRHNNRTANTIAVAQTYLDVEYVADPEYRTAFVDRIVERGKPWLQAIQFDLLPWHTDASMLPFLAEVKEKHELPILLQCHGNAMELLGPRSAIRRLGRFASYIDYILFDASHGTGTRLDTTRLGEFLEEAHESERLDNLSFAIAGGLNAEIVREELPALVDTYPGLSWDAEGQLHPLDTAGKRPLDMYATLDYLLASADVLQRVT